MSKFLSKLKGFFSSRTLAGVDKAGNHYFTMKEEVDGIMKEKRWVKFKGDEDPTSIPVEWICWLNGQRKRAPTPEEIIQLEANRERIKQNILLLKKEEEKRKAAGIHLRQSKNIGKDVSPDLKSFIQQFPGASFKHNKGNEEASDAQVEKASDAQVEPKHEDRTSEPIGSGASFKPGTWQPPS